ncbi:hypothetical protein NC652_018511 [Populus alba x Populus x berolinensis]|nr:hypothetical protein NC652_018511 [Populus alba x Populus x berolinensis]
MNHRRFLVTVSMLDMSAMVILNVRNCIVSTSGRGNGHACPHPTPDIIQNRLDTGIMLRLSMDRDEVLNTSRINWAFHGSNLGLAEQDEEKVAEFKQSMIAFFKIVRIDLGSHNVASPLLDGSCRFIHVYAWMKFSNLYGIDVHGLDEAMRGLPLDDDFTISYTSLLDEKSNTFCLIFTFARR